MSCHLEDERPVVIGVEARGPRGSMAGRVVFEHPAGDDESWPLALRSLESDLHGALKRERPSAVVVRSLNFHNRQKVGVVRPHYQVEGVLLLVAGQHVGLVEALDGKSIGRVARSSWEAAKAEAAVLGKDRDAAAAALAALILAGEA